MIFRVNVFFSNIQIHPIGRIVLTGHMSVNAPVKVNPGRPSRCVTGICVTIQRRLTNTIFFQRHSDITNDRNIDLLGEDSDSEM